MMLPHDQNHASEERCVLSEPSVKSPVEQTGEELRDKQPNENGQGEDVPGWAHCRPMHHEPIHTPQRPAAIQDKPDRVERDIGARHGWDGDFPFTDGCCGAFHARPG